MIIIVCHMIWWLLSLEAYYRNGHNLSHVCMSPPVTIAISNQHQPSWPPCQREKHTREDWCPSTADRVHTCQERNMTAVTLTWAQSPVYSQWAAFSSHHFFFPFRSKPIIGNGISVQYLRSCSRFWCLCSSVSWLVSDVNGNVTFGP